MEGSIERSNLILNTMKYYLCYLFNIKNEKVVVKNLTSINSKNKKKKAFIGSVSNRSSLTFRQMWSVDSL